MGDISKKVDPWHLKMLPWNYEEYSDVVQDENGIENDVSE